MKSNEIIIVGVGTAGSRAAYYIYKRGGIAGVRILGIDSDGDSLAALPGIETLQAVAPELAEDEFGNLTAEAQQFYMKLHRYVEAARLVVVVTCLGRPTGDYFSTGVLKFAKEINLHTVAIAAMPHTFDAPAWHGAARETLERLRHIADTVLPLPCCEFGRFFPDQTQAEAYPQAARWIAETAIGFVSLFASSVVSRGNTDIKNSPRVVNDDGNIQPYLDFKDLPLGIFAISEPSRYNGTNYDLPTFMRKGLEVDDGI